MILDDILIYREVQLDKEKSLCSEAEMKKRAERYLSERTPLSLAKAVRQDKLSCICEVKKASPSKGLIRPDFMQSIFTKISYLISRKPIKTLSKAMDYKSYGGALFSRQQRISSKYTEKC